MPVEPNGTAGGHAPSADGGGGNGPAGGLEAAAAAGNLEAAAAAAAGTGMPAGTGDTPAGARNALTGALELLGGRPGELAIGGSAGLQAAGAALREARMAEQRLQAEVARLRGAPGGHEIVEQSPAAGAVSTLGRRDVGQQGDLAGLLRRPGLLDRAGTISAQEAARFRLVADRQAEDAAAARAAMGTAGQGWRQHGRIGTCRHRGRGRGPMAVPGRDRMGRSWDRPAL